MFECWDHGSLAITEVCPRIFSVCAKEDSVATTGKLGVGYNLSKWKLRRYFKDKRFIELQWSEAFRGFMNLY